MAVESFDANYPPIYALPEDCISKTLSLTTPKDACRLSAVAGTFRSAALSDAVWERFLPSDYRDIISLSEGGTNSLLKKFKSKKDLYLHLCDNPILIDGGRKNFSLEKGSGKKCYTLSARDLDIVWGDTDQYWQWTSDDKSRFSEVADLKAVCWFEVRGRIKIKMLSPGTNYAAYLVFSRCGVYGFDYKPCEAFLGTSGHEGPKSNICLVHQGRERPWQGTAPRRLRGFLSLRRNQDVDPNTRYPTERGDGWMEVELGDVFVEGEEDGHLEISLMEVKGGNWKGGIVIEGIEIRPKCK